MLADDFCYDGHWLSEYDFMIVQFKESSGFQEDTAGSQMEISTIPQFGGRINRVISAQYAEPFQIEIGICKRDGSEVNRQEYSRIMTWLNRNQYCRFQIDNDDWSDVYFMGSFNIQRQLHYGKTVGFLLTFTADSPFGRLNPCSGTMNFSSNNSSVYINNKSEDVGFLYFDTFKISCKSSGTLILSNATDGKSLVISGCRSGEIIEIDCNTRTISTNITSHDIHNCFNYNFPRLVRSYDNSVNHFISSLTCIVNYTYTPIVKAVV